jgi:hypothetical protein
MMRILSSFPLSASPRLSARLSVLYTDSLDLWCILRCGGLNAEYAEKNQEYADEALIRVLLVFPSAYSALKPFTLRTAQTTAVSLPGCMKLRAPVQFRALDMRWACAGATGEKSAPGAELRPL